MAYKKRKGSWTEEEKKILAEMYENGETILNIRVKLNKHHSTIVSQLKELGRYRNPIIYWTKEEDEKLKDLRVNKQLSYGEIAKIFNCDVGRLKARAKRLKISNVYNKIHWDDTKNEKLKKLINDKLPIPEIAGKFNCDEDVIRKQCKVLGLVSLAKKLIYTQEQLDEIVDLHYSGWLDRDIGKKLNMAEQTIKHIRRKEGFYITKNKIWTKEEEVKLLNMIESGEPLASVKKEFKRFVSDILRKIWELKPDYRTRSVTLKRFLYSTSHCALDASIDTKLYNAKKNSLLRGREFNIKKEDIEELFVKQDGKCFYTGKTLETDPGDNKLYSIDRMDSSRGYTKDNVVLCTWEINKLKSNLPIKDFREICHLVDTYSPYSPEYEI